MRTLTLLALIGLTGTPLAAEEHPNSIHLGAGFNSNIGAFVEVAYENRPRGIDTGLISIPVMAIVCPRAMALPAVSNWILQRRGNVTLFEFGGTSDRAKQIERNLGIALPDE